MKNETRRNYVFFALCILLALLPFTIELGSSPAFAFIGIACACLGLYMVRLENRLADPLGRKLLFKVAGIASLGPAFGILHNIPLIQNAWASVADSHDEPFFFLLAALICPALFVLSASGCIGLLVRDHFTNKTPGEQYP